MRSRRGFITLLGGAAAAWPLAARAQQSGIPVIGYVRSESFNLAQHMVAGFRQGLKEMGYTEHENVAIEYHSAEGNRERLSAIVAELVRRQVAMIVGIASRHKLPKPHRNLCRLSLYMGATR